MKNIRAFITAVAVVCTTGLYAQSTGYTYNKYINQAELHIVEGNYKKALSTFDEAFSSAKTEFAIDLYNACVCAVKLNNKAKLLYYADRLAGRGVGKNFFQRSIFKEYLNDKKFKAIIARAEKVKEEKARANETFCKDLDVFFNLDTLYNSIRLDKHPKNGITPENLQILFRENAKNMVNYIIANGYFSEEKLGADISQDTIINSAYRPDIVFLHYLEMGSSKEIATEIKDILLDNLNRGTIKPSHIATVAQLSYEVFGPTGDWIFSTYNGRLYRINEIEGLQKINYFRDFYCLETIEDYEKKLVYTYSTLSQFDFGYRVITSHISDPEFFLSNFHEIAVIK